MRIRSDSETYSFNQLMKLCVGQRYPAARRAWLRLGRQYLLSKAHPGPRRLNSSSNGEQEEFSGKRGLYLIRSKYAHILKKDFSRSPAVSYSLELKHNKREVPECQISHIDHRFPRISEGVNGVYVPEKHDYVLQSSPSRPPSRDATLIFPFSESPRRVTTTRRVSPKSKVGTICFFAKTFCRPCIYF